MIRLPWSSVANLDDNEQYYNWSNNEYGDANLKPQQVDYMGGMAGDFFTVDVGGGKRSVGEMDPAALQAMGTFVGAAFHNYYDAYNNDPSVGFKRFYQVPANLQKVLDLPSKTFDRPGKLGFQFAGAQQMPRMRDVFNVLFKAGVYAASVQAPGLFANSTDYEDAIQTAAVRLYDAIPGYQPPLALSEGERKKKPGYFQWISNTVRNALYDWNRTSRDDLNRTARGLSTDIIAPEFGGGATGMHTSPEGPVPVIGTGVSGVESYLLDEQVIDTDPSTRINRVLQRASGKWGQYGMLVGFKTNPGEDIYSLAHRAEQGTLEAWFSRPSSGSVVPPTLLTVGGSGLFQDPQAAPPKFYERIAQQMQDQGAAWLDTGLHSTRKSKKLLQPATISASPAYTQTYTEMGPGGQLIEYTHPGWSAETSVSQYMPFSELNQLAAGPRKINTGLEHAGNPFQSSYPVYATPQDVLAAGHAYDEITSVPWKERTSQQKKQYYLLREGFKNLRRQIEPTWSGNDPEEVSYDPFGNEIESTHGQDVNATRIPTWDYKLAEQADRLIQKQVRNTFEQFGPGSFFNYLFGQRSTTLSQTATRGSVVLSPSTQSRHGEIVKFWGYSHAPVSLAQSVYDPRLDPYSKHYEGSALPASETPMQEPLPIMVSAPERPFSLLPQLTQYYEMAARSGTTPVERPINPLDVMATEMAQATDQVTYMSRQNEVIDIGNLSSGVHYGLAGKGPAAPRDPRKTQQILEENGAQLVVHQPEESGPLTIHIDQQARQREVSEASDVIARVRAAAKALREEANQVPVEAGQVTETITEELLNITGKAEPVKKKRKPRAKKLVEETLQPAVHQAEETVEPELNPNPMPEPDPMPTPVRSTLGTPFSGGKAVTVGRPRPLTYGETPFPGGLEHAEAVHGYGDGVTPFNGGASPARVAEAAESNRQAQLTRVQESIDPIGRRNLHHLEPHNNAERLANMFQEVPMGSIASFDHQLYGKGNLHQNRDGSVAYQVLGPNGELHAGTGLVSGGYKLATQAYAAALNGPMPQGGESQAGTVMARMNDFINKNAKGILGAIDEVKDLDGPSKKVAQDTVKQIAKHFAKKAGDLLLGENGDVPASEGNAFGYSAQRLGSAEDVAKASERYKSFASALSGMGLTPEQFVKSKDKIVIANSDDGYSFSGGGGGWGDDGGGGGPPRDPTQTKKKDGFGGFGRTRGIAQSMAFGGYILSSAWKQAAGQALAESDTYSDYMGGFAQTGMMMGDTMQNSAAGDSWRRQQTQRYFQRTANQAFGGFSDVGYALSQSGDAFGRLAATSKVGFGIGMGAALMPTMFGIGGATAAGIGIAGAAIGGGIIAGQIGLEIGNANGWWGGEQLSYGKIASDVTRRYFPDKFAAKDTLIGSSMTGMVKTPGKADYLDDAENIFLTAGLAQSPGLLLDYKQNREANIAARGQDTGTAAADKISDLANSLEKAGLDPDAAQKTANIFAMATKGAVTPEKSSAAIKGGYAASRTEGDVTSGADAYASSFGYGLGTLDYASKFQDYLGMAEGGEVGRFIETDIQASRRSQFNAQMQPYFNTAATAASAARYFSNQPAVTAAGAVGYSLQSAYGNIGDTRMDAAMTAFAGKSAQYTNSATSIMNAYNETSGASAGSALALTQSLGGANVSNYQMGMAQKIANGDRGAASYASWQMGPMAGPEMMAMRMFDVAGNRIGKYNGDEMTRTLRANLQTNSKFQGMFAQATGLSGLPSDDYGAMSAFLGSDNEEIVKAYQKYGEQASGYLNAKWSYDQTIKSAGIQGAGIALQENYYWGKGGSWNKPQAGSAWYIEDQMNAIQKTSQLADFAYQKQSMQRENKYAVAREDQSLARMNLSQGYQAEQMSFNYAAQLQSRSWAKEDWQYQDTQRGLSNAWSMEDINENIRFSSGRQRRDLLKQRDRMAISQNLEGQQVDKSRERQEQMWSKEDERYEKQVEYIAQINKMDRDSFELNKKQREEAYAAETKNFNRKVSEYAALNKLEEEARQLSRKYQADQLNLQKASIGLQIEQAKKQKELAEASLTASKNMDGFIGTLGQLDKYDGATAVVQSLQYLMQLMGTQNVSTSANALQTFANTLNSKITESKINLLIQLINEIGN